MALAYNIWTEEEIQNRNLVEKGDYDFEIMAASVKKTQSGIDKNGNPKLIRDMLEIDFNYWDKNGQVRRVKDWIVFGEGMDWKLRHLANTIGLIELYENNSLDAHHLLKKQGVFELGIKEFEKDGVKKKTNFVVDYVKKSDPKNDTRLNDSIPF